MSRIILPTARTICRHPQDADRAFGRMIELMRHDRVVAYFRRDELDDRATAGGKHDGLQAVQRVFRVAVEIDAVERRSDDVKRRHLVRTGVKDIQPDPVAGLGAQRLVLQSEVAAVENDILRLAIQKRFEIVPLVPFALDDRIRAVDVAVAGKPPCGSTMIMPYMPLAICARTGFVPQ